MKTVSLELAQRLHGAGVRMETIFGWYRVNSDQITGNININPMVLKNKGESLLYMRKLCNAPMIDELMSCLPEKGTFLLGIKGKDRYSVWDNFPADKPLFVSDNPADALAMLAIHLKEKS